MREGETLRGIFEGLEEWGSERTGKEVGRITRGEGEDRGENERMKHEIEIEGKGKGGEEEGGNEKEGTGRRREEVNGGECAKIGDANERGKRRKEGGEVKEYKRRKGMRKGYVKKRLAGKKGEGRGEAVERGKWHEISGVEGSVIVGESRGGLGKMRGNREEENEGGRNREKKISRERVWEGTEEIFEK
ncbi:hypothetical protein Tco_1194070 [Tanacetum coccineum]|uniref:Uncharacterized protein n=1 Tax=Tanacetum coccineum TaxID=301880 RepID=A0ABQ4WQ00_9ASTR